MPDFYSVRNTAYTGYAVLRIDGAETQLCLYSPDQRTAIRYIEDEPVCIGAFALLGQKADGSWQLLYGEDNQVADPELAVEEVVLRDGKEIEQRFNPTSPYRSARKDALYQLYWSEDEVETVYLVRRNKAACNEPVYRIVSDFYTETEILDSGDRVGFVAAAVNLNDDCVAKFYKFFDGEKKLVYDETSIGTNRDAFYVLWLEASDKDETLFEDRILGYYTSICEVRVAVARAMTNLESWSDHLFLCVNPDQLDHPIDLNIWSNRSAELTRKKALKDIWLNYARANELDGEALFDD